MLRACKFYYTEEDDYKRVRWHFNEYIILNAHYVVNLKENL